MGHLRGCVGFWLWALVGAGAVLGFVGLGWFALAPAALAVVLLRRSKWRDGPVLLGTLAGAGLPLLLVAAVQWSSWQHRIPGDNTPDPYAWGGVGVCLLFSGIAAFSVRSRHPG